MPASITIPLSDNDYALSVWCAPGPTLPTLDILQRTYFNWLARYCDDPFRTSLQTWTEKRRVNCRVVPVGATPAPTLATLRQAGAGDTEEARLARATHEVLVSARDTGEPRLALWNVVGMARSVALQYAGVIMDRDVPRLVPLETYTRRLLTGIRAMDFAQVLAVPQREGRAHLCVRGLRKFGLPTVEVQYVAADIQPQMALLLQVLAQVLVYRARKTLGNGGRSLAVPPELRLDLDHEALRRVQWKVDAQRNALRATNVRLSFDSSGEGTLRLEPPAGFRGDPRGWMAPTIQELLGGELVTAPPPEDDGEPLPADPLEAAHRKALKELPELRRRYQKGLPSGHDVYVKRAFPLPNGDREFMWIHVTSWYDAMVRGRLATHPRWRTDLHAGQTLQCSEEDVYDWLLIFPDGREMGGYTDQVPQQRRVPRPIPF